jgi:hypothetical protein
MANGYVTTIEHDQKATIPGGVYTVSTYVLSTLAIWILLPFPSNYDENSGTINYNFQFISYIAHLSIIWIL